MTNTAKTLRNMQAKSLEANSKQYGGGTAVYGVGNNVGSGNGPSEGSDMTFGPELRWDLYQKLGNPEIKTLEDYLTAPQKNAGAQSEERLRKACVWVFAVVGLGQ